MTTESKLNRYKSRIEQSTISILRAEKSIAQLLLYKRIVWEESNVLSKHVSAGGNRWYEINGQAVPEHLGVSKMYTQGHSYLSDLQGRAIYRALLNASPGLISSESELPTTHHWSCGQTIQIAIDAYEKKRNGPPWPQNPQQAMKNFLNRDNHETDRSAGLQSHYLGNG